MALHSTALSYFDCSHCLTEIFLFSYFKTKRKEIMKLMQFRICANPSACTTRSHGNCTVKTNQKWRIVVLWYKEVKSEILGETVQNVRWAWMRTAIVCSAGTKKVNISRKNQRDLFRSNLFCFDKMAYPKYLPSFQYLHLCSVKSEMYRSWCPCDLCVCMRMHSAALRPLSENWYVNEWIANGKMISLILVKRLLFYNRFCSYRMYSSLNVIRECRP